MRSSILHVLLVVVEAAEAAGREPPESSPQMELARADRHFSRGRFDEAIAIYEAAVAHLRCTATPPSRRCGAR